MQKNELLDNDCLNWDDYTNYCQANYSSFANIHLVSARAPEVVNQAHVKGVLFTLVCDGNNDNVGSLNKLDIYKKLAIDMNITKIECLIYDMRNMVDTLKNH